jgi:alpha-tubulin suppressor-like RCC1 family protein
MRVVPQFSTTTPWRCAQHFAALVLLGLTLVGCGGGGGGNGGAEITVQAAPKSQTVSDGESAVLAVLATSPALLSYQWLRNDTPISGATTPVYATPALTLADTAARFSVIVRSADRSVTTPPAVVTVRPVPPSVTSAPQAQTLRSGQSASFSAVAQGSQPLSYQWQRDGVDIAGATNASYSTEPATAQDAGAQFRVVVRNAGGEVASEEAVLRVEGAAPVVIGLLQIGVAAPGQSLLISTRVSGNPPYAYQWWRNGVAVAGASGSTDDPSISFNAGALQAADNGVRFALTVSTADGTTRSPDAVIAVLSPTRMVAGDGHSLARSASGGTVWAWGDNSHGQLGLGTRDASPVPAVVSGLAGVKALAAGADHSLALMDDGSVKAWGRNASGALGDGTQSDRLAPQTVPGLTNVIAVAAGPGRSFAVRADGSVWAWGENGSGALGNGNQNGSLVPTAVGPGVAGFVAIVAVAAGTRHSLGLRADGRVFAWGEGAAAAVQASPVLVDGLSSVAALAAGEGFSIALDTNARLWSWGANDRSQLGLGDTVPRSAPTRIVSNGAGAALLPLLGIAAGRDFALARAFDGAVLAWGEGASGQIGGGEPASGSTAPRTLAPLATPLVSVTAGRGHGLAMRNDGTLYAWGANAAGQLGIGSNEARRAEPVQIPALDLD